MSLFANITSLSRDLLEKDILVNETANAAHALACKLTESNQKFWDKEDDRVLAVLNADVNATLLTFQLNTQLGLAVNAALEAVVASNPLLSAKFFQRAPVEMGNPRIEFNMATGQFQVKGSTPVLPEEPTPPADPPAEPETPPVDP